MSQAAEYHAMAVYDDKGQLLAWEDMFGKNYFADNVTLTQVMNAGHQYTPECDCQNYTSHWLNCLSGTDLVDMIPVEKQMFFVCGCFWDMRRKGEVTELGMQRIMPLIHSLVSVALDEPTRECLHC